MLPFRRIALRSPNAGCKTMLSAVSQCSLSGAANLKSTNSGLFFKAGDIRGQQVMIDRSRPRMCQFLREAAIASLEGLRVLIITAFLAILWERVHAVVAVHNARIRLYIGARPS